MKTIVLMLIALAITMAGAYGQAAQNSTASGLPASPYQVKSTGPHHRLWQREVYLTLPDGGIRTNSESYWELGSCLNYLDSKGNWRASQPTIEIYPGGAVAQQGQNRIIFANNLNTEGAIDAQMTGGTRLRSTVLGLLYSDPTTGQSVQIATLQDSEGELVADDDVLYPSALVDTNTGVVADVLYENRIDGLAAEATVAHGAAVQ